MWRRSDLNPFQWLVVFIAMTFVVPPKPLEMLMELPGIFDARYFSASEQETVSIPKC